MKFLTDTRISTRLGLSFAFMALLVTLLAGGSFLNMRTVNETFHILIDDRYEKISELNDLKDNAGHIARSMASALLQAGTEQAKSEVEDVLASRKRAAETLRKLEGQALDAEARAALGAVLEARAKYVDVQERFIAHLNAGSPDEARTLLLGDGQKAQTAYFNRLDRLIEHQSAAMARTAKSAEAEIDRMMLLSWSTGVAALGAAALLAWLAIRSVTRPLHRAVEATHAIANGDLTVGIDARGSNEMAQLLASLRDMQAALAEVVSNVRGNAESVAAASTQISQGNHHLSGRTEEQASALQQTAASMKQLSATVKQNAADAEQASQLAVGASGVATKGGALMEEVVQTMKGINESSRRIADIIGVIDGIAFQTNILALNAAVEAARAGEQGRGFAVVAGEVRTLAQRSAEAAKEIKDLITASVERAEQGSALVDRAGTTMGEVVGSIQRVSDLMARINRANQEQSAGVAQIGEAVAQMDQATQQNAALVEQSAAAAESLKAQSQDLVNAVSVFRVAGVHQLVQRAAPAAAPVAEPATVAAPSPAPVAARVQPRPAPAKPAAQPAAAATTADDEWTTF